MRIPVILFFIFSFQAVKAQELYVFTEPASNMAAKSIGIRVDNMLTKDLYKGKNAVSFHLVPSVMWGISKRIMMHFAGYGSDKDGKFTLNGGGIYFKYRFFSNEDVHNHLRMAAFASYSINNSLIHEYAIDLTGHNSGHGAGLVATQLRKKTAMSATVSFAHATDNIGEHFLFGNKLRNTFNYSASVGRLMLPKEYTSYKQTNMNLMLEFLGQMNLYNGYTWLDIAPAVQFIFNSRARLDIGYRYTLAKKLQRYHTQGALIRLEYNFFTIY